MTLKAAEDFENIARRLKELGANQQLALTGSSAPSERLKPVESGYGEYAMGFPAFGASFGRLGNGKSSTNLDDWSDYPDFD